MKISNTLTLLSSCLLLIFLSSCDPVVDYEKAILNATGNELLLVRNNPLVFDFQDATLDQLLLDSAVVAAGSRQMLTEGFDIGGTVEAYIDCPGYMEEGDTIFVFTSTRNTWTQASYITQSDFKGRHRKLSKSRCECLLELTDDMLE